MRNMMATLEKLVPSSDCNMMAKLEKSNFKYDQEIQILDMSKT